MLTYLARTLPLAVRARARATGQRISYLERRVRLSEIDFNLHMNQAAYAQVGELGRVDWVLSSGAWARWNAEDVRPVVAEQRIAYRRELKPFQRYVVTTRATGVEGRLLTIESLLLVGPQVHARSWVKLIFIGRDGVLTPQRAETVCAGLVMPPLEVDAWSVSLDAVNAERRAT